jgi:hypothetical protein
MDALESLLEPDYLLLLDLMTPWSRSKFSLCASKNSCNCATVLSFAASILITVLG